MFSLLCEVLPSLRGEFARFAVLGFDDDSLAANNTPNLRNRNACDASGDTASLRDSKEQFVVFSAVQSEAQINFLDGFSNDCPRN